jgi:16S rRNA (adenine1518-N6/adenine1519-N6)-dimethyltransferase
VAAGVDPTARGEVIDIGAFARIAEARQALA